MPNKTKEMTKEEKSLEIMTKIMWSYVGTPYIWGGDDFSGFDCSGLMVEGLRGVGKMIRKDSSAQGLWGMMNEWEVDEPSEGCLIFYGSNKHNGITHVEYAISEWHMIGASGGGSKTKTRQDAIDQNAYVKVKPIRAGYVAIVKPFHV
jgi:D-gamma-glutamyl-meso-diaminopimelic acid endopeptidase CwlS